MKWLIIFSLFFAHTLSAQEPKELNSKHELVNFLEQEFPQLISSRAWITNREAPYLIMQKLKDKNFRKTFIELSFSLEMNLLKETEQYYQDKKAGKTVFKNLTRVTGGHGRLEYGSSDNSYRAYEHLRIPDLIFSSAGYMSQEEFNDFLSTLENQFNEMNLAIENINTAKLSYLRAQPDFVDTDWEDEKVISNFFRYTVMLPPTKLFRTMAPLSADLANLDPAILEEIKTSTARYFHLIDFILKGNFVTEGAAIEFVNDWNYNYQETPDPILQAIFSDSQVAAEMNKIFSFLAQRYPVSGYQP